MGLKKCYLKVPLVLKKFMIAKGVIKYILNLEKKLTC